MKTKITGLKTGLRFGAVLVIVLICYSYLIFAHVPLAQAATGINQQLNFQGRLFDSTGAVVADGSYNVEYKIYQDGDGCVSGGSSPCSGTLKWTETRIQTNRVTVRNGYLSVNLGSITAFGSSVDWNQDTLWLSVNIGGTTNTPTPTWDGEMTPFKRLTSTPYALNTSTLQGLQASSFVQIAQGVQVDTSTVNPSIFINKNNVSGSPNIIELQKAGVDVFSIDNTGNIAATGTYNTNTLTGSVLTFGAAGTASIDAVSGQNLQVGTSASSHTLTLGSVTGTSTTVLQAGSGGVTLSANTTIANDKTLTANGPVLLENNANSTTALQVQSATAANTLLTADTTNNKVVIGDATGTNGNTTQLVVDSATADPSAGYNGSLYYNTTQDTFRCYQGGVWADCLNGAANSTLSVVSGLANVAANQTGIGVEALVFTTATAVSNTAGGTGFTAAAGGSFRTCLIKNNAAITAGTLALRWRVNGASVGAAACPMSNTVNRSSSTALDAGVVTFSQGDTLGIAFDTNAGYLPVTADYTVYWTIEYNSTLTNAGATLQSAYNNSNTLTTTDTHSLLINAADTATDASLLFDLQCVTSCAANGRFAVQNAGTDVFTVSPNSGNITLAPAGAGSVVVTADANSNAQINYVSTTDDTLAVAQVSILDNANANTGSLYGLTVLNNDNGANTGVPDALAYLRNANAAEVVVDGLLVEQTGAGTLTNGLEIKRTAGTITNGLTFTGTFGTNLINGGAALTVTAAGAATIGSDLTVNGVTLLLGNGSAATIGTPSGAAGLTIAPDTSGALSLATTNTGAVAIGNATGTFALTSNGGLNVTTGGALTGVASIDTITASATGLTFAGAGTISSTGANNLNLNSGVNGGVSITPGGTGDLVVTLDNDTNVQFTTGNISANINPVAISATYTGDQTSNGLDITITDNASASSGELYGLSVTNADNGANTGVPDALGYLRNANAAETVMDGLLVEQAGAGTLTNGLEIKRTAGTVSNGLTFTGTIGSEIKLQNSETISNGTNGTIALAADSGAVVLSLSGTAATLSNTAGALNVTSAAGLTLASSANGNVAINPNGTGDFVLTQGAGSGAQITASAAPTIDMLAISNSGLGNVTAGVSGLQITYIGGAAAVEASGQRIDITGGTTAGAGAIWNGLRLVQGTITAGTTVQDIKLETAALTTTSGTTVINGLNLSTAGAINSSTAGSIAWNGLSITNANVTQGAGGSASSNGLVLNLGTITTAGTQTGLEFNNITAPTAGQTIGLNFGTGNSTSWSDLHSSTVASSNLANIAITKSAAGATANTFTIKNDASTMVNLFELRDLTANTNRFGGLALADAFASRQSYFGEEFTSIRTNCNNATFAAATNNLSRGSQASGGVVSTTACTTSGTDIGNGEISTSSVSGTSAAANVCQYQSAANAPGTNTNGFESIITTTGATTVNVQCLEYIGTATDNTGNMIFNSGNLPQIQVKFRPVQLAQAQRFYLGIGTKVTATNALLATNKGVYFTNCTVPNTPTCGTGLNVVLEDGVAAPTTVTPTNAMACPATDADSNAFTANLFAYGRLEFRKDTTGTGVEIQAFVDYNVTNGIRETSCGTLLTTANAMGNTPMTMVAMTAVTATGAALTSRLDLDYFRVWQDDAPAFADIATPTPDANLNTPSTMQPDDSAAPLTVASSGAGPDPDGTKAVMDFMAATDQDTVFSGDVYVKGTLYADKIKANQIEGIEVITDKISSLQAQVAKNKLAAASGGTPPPTPTPTPTVASDLTALKGVQAINLTVLAQIESKGGLTVDQDARFHGKTLFDLLAEFNGPVKFNGAVSFNNDAGGLAEIKKDAREVEINFTKEYGATPIVTANYLFKAVDPLDDQALQKRLSDGGYSFVISQSSAKGFRIILNKPAAEDITFSWLATLINNPQVSQSKTVTLAGQ